MFPQRFHYYEVSRQKIFKLWFLQVLNDLFYPDDSINTVIEPEVDDDNEDKEESYDEVVQKFITAERKYVERDLYMITKVFR